MDNFDSLKKPANIKNQVKKPEYSLKTELFQAIVFRFCIFLVANACLEIPLCAEIPSRYIKRTDF